MQKVHHLAKRYLVDKKLFLFQLKQTVIMTLENVKGKKLVTTYLGHLAMGKCHFKPTGTEKLRILLKTEQVTLS